MRVAVIFGLGCSLRQLKPFQSDSKVDWRVGVPRNGQADAILLFGGDGTIHRHLGQLVELALPVLVVPAGSGNDFASSLGLRRVRDSLAAWRKFHSGGANVRQIDLGTIIGVTNAGEASAPHGVRYFCCVAGVGLDGEVSRRANRLPRWLRGNGGYVLGLAPAIFSFAPFPLKILISENGQRWVSRSDQPTLLAAFANAPQYGGGMRIAPQANMDDGLLDVCIVGGISRLKLLSLFPTVYGGKHLGIGGVGYFQTGRARLETGSPVDVYADGEYVCRTPVEIGVERRALRLITPA